MRDTVKNRIKWSAIEQLDSASRREAPWNAMKLVRMMSLQGTGRLEDEMHCFITPSDPFALTIIFLPLGLRGGGA